MQCSVRPAAAIGSHPSFSPGHVAVSPIASIATLNTEIYSEIENVSENPLGFCSIAPPLYPAKWHYECIFVVLYICLTAIACLPLPPQPDHILSETTLHYGSGSSSSSSDGSYYRDAPENPIPINNNNNNNNYKLLYMRSWRFTSYTKNRYSTTATIIQYIYYSLFATISC